MSRYDRIKRREDLAREERYRMQRESLDASRREFERLRAENPEMNDYAVHALQQQNQREQWRRSYENNVFGGFAVGFFKTLLVVIVITLIVALPQLTIIELLLGLAVFAML